MFRRAALLFLALLTTSANAQKPADRIEKLAASGKIQENAPVKASSEITIHASPEKVWHLLTDIDNWPQWQSMVSAAKINGPLEPGTTFVWRQGSTKIKSRIALAHPVSELVWTGTTFGARGIHAWNLRPLPDGSTLVKTSESLNGFLLRLRIFYSSNDLAKQQKVWLEALKHKGEE
jgi:hypothetical protein